MIDHDHLLLSMRRQCTLLGLNCSSLYSLPAQESEENLLLMRLIDEQYTRAPFYRSRRMTAWLRGEGYPVNRKRVQRLMGKMGLEAICPKPRLSVGPDHKVYPYLLRGLEIHRPNQVWGSDITYVAMRHGFMYLVAILDWYSREVEVGLDNYFWFYNQERLHQALGYRTPAQIHFNELAGKRKLEGGGRISANCLI